jgi:hypothetical protein
MSRHWPISLGRRPSAPCDEIDSLNSGNAFYGIYNSERSHRGIVATHFPPAVLLSRVLRPQGLSQFSLQELAAGASR